MGGGFTIFNMSIAIVGVILITAGVKGATVKQVVKDSVANVSKPNGTIVITGTATSVKTPNTGGNADVATGK